MFTIYISPIAHIATAHGLTQQQYADDTQLYVAITRSNHDIATSRLEECLSELHIWFCYNGLALNPNKTDAILFGTAQRSKSLPPITTINVAGTTVSLSKTIKILGVVLDSKLSFDSHVSNISKSCFYHIRALRHIHPVLTDDVAKTIACSMVGCRLDYANSVLLGISAKNMQHLHRIQSSLARVVTQQRGRISITNTF